MTYPQKKTLLSIVTPFGPEAVLLIGFRGEERISGLFRFDLDIASPERALDFKAVVGKGITVKVALSKGAPRCFHGVCTRFRQAGRVDKQTIYHAELHPWLWLLTRTTDSRIFQNKSTPEILKAVFSDLGFSDFKDSLKGSYAKREYCVQYQESSFDFVSRLMEDEGIHYSFNHEEGKHTLVLSDDSAGSPPCPDLPKARFIGEMGSSMRDEDAVLACTLEEEIVAGGYATTDYNFETPTTPLLAKADGAGGNLKLFEYPGNHATKGDGESRAKLRIEAEEAIQKRLTGSSLCRAFSAGHTFKLVEHDRSDLNDKEYVLLSVTHMAANEEYRNAFEAFPKTVTFRPPRVTPRPSIPGSQTALVVGKSGEEIWTDKYGRIMVHFYWDRLGKKDDKSSCWIRVAQGWAGKGFGAFFLPRIGQEVIVSFLGGDPDRPIVTGCVYNAQQTVPYDLPDAQTKSTLLSRSSKSGKAGNELRFEDKKDSEEVYVHAQKDMKFLVENDWVIDVKHDQTTTVKNDRKATISEGNEFLTVTKGNRTIEVTKGNETHKVKGTRALTVEGDESATNKGMFSQKVTKDYTLKIDGDLVIEAKSVTIKAGQAFTMKAGTDFKAESGTGMNLKAGTELAAKAGTSMALEGGVSLKAKGGATADVEGGGMLTLKGGLVKIN